MLPPVTLAESVEMLRDGGSLCASFQGANGARYWLLIPVKRGPDGKGELAILGYDTPVIVERPIAAEEIHVSWEHAEILLNQVALMLASDANQQWIDPTYQCIRNEGYWVPTQSNGPRSVLSPRE